MNKISIGSLAPLQQELVVATIRDGIVDSHVSYERRIKHPPSVGLFKRGDGKEFIVPLYSREQTPAFCLNKIQMVAGEATLSTVSVGGNVLNKTAEDGTEYRELHIGKDEVLYEIVI